MILSRALFIVSIAGLCSFGGGCGAPGGGDTDAGLSDDGASCMPATCASLGRTCGTFDDGCGGELTCAVSCEVFTDARDGRHYTGVRIGTQVWMSSNLAYGAPDSYCVNGTVFSASEECGAYGRYYDWSTANAESASSNASPSGVRGICPAGWHLPSRAEVEAMLDFVAAAAERTRTGDTWPVAQHLKAQGVDWAEPPNGANVTGASGAYGFDMLAGSMRNSAAGAAGSVHMTAFFWTATDDGSNPYAVRMYYADDVVDFALGSYSWLVPVRCVKD